jgi:hypothetical protein
MVVGYCNQSPPASAIGSAVPGATLLNLLEDASSAIPRRLRSLPTQSCSIIA